MKFFKSLFKRKSTKEKLVAKLLKENNCVCYCKVCSYVLSDSSESTKIDSIYKEVCPNCGYVSYFDYSQPAPFHLSVGDFEQLSKIVSLIKENNK